jgi:hypothetical protein
MSINDRFRLNVVMFGVLVLPSLDKRRQILSHLEEILEWMNFFGPQNERKN